MEFFYKYNAANDHFFRDLYAKLRASRCSMHDVKDIWFTSKVKSRKRGRETRVSYGVKKTKNKKQNKKPPYKIDSYKLESTARSIAKLY